MPDDFLLPGEDQVSANCLAYLKRLLPPAPSLMKPLA
jgi:hypothetical protein